MGLGDVFGMFFGHLFDVDSTHVAEYEYRLLGAAVPGDRHEILLGDGALLFHQNGAGRFALDHDGHDGLVMGRRLIGAIGKLHGTRLHAPARKDLALEDDGAADLLEGPSRRLDGFDHATLGEGQAVFAEEGLGFVFVESHRGFSPMSGRRPGIAGFEISAWRGTCGIRRCRRFLSGVFCPPTHIS